MASGTASGRARETAAAGRRRGGVAPIEYHLLMLVTLGLVAFGLIMVYSASSGTAVLFGRDPVAVLVKQGIYAGLGIARWPAWRGSLPAPALHGRARARAVVVLLLVLVLVPGIGAEINNARRWLLLGPISIQPSEFAKAAMLLFAAAVLASTPAAAATLMELINPLGAVVLVVCALVEFEPDLGTTIAIVLMVCGVLVVARDAVPAVPVGDDPGAGVAAYTVIRRAVPDAADHHVPRSAEGSAGDRLPGDPGELVTALGSGGWTVSGWATAPRRATRRRRRRT